MKIKGVDFPEPLLNALRDGRLVVFAGAGVSMGPPAGLPSFRKLAERVAEGTGQSIAGSETDDQFLGRLKDPGVQVHRLAAEALQRDNLEPNALHRNLLRLFKKTGPVRIVTTNFDCLFEQAAKAGDLFQTQPKVFEAPALPPGSRFQGIVHLHGSVNEPEEMVLTHRDFGRAYLTEEDGWARRFLVSLFTKGTSEQVGVVQHQALTSPVPTRLSQSLSEPKETCSEVPKHTVLFVGYSHSDTIMTYLTPSLPPDGTERRFALVGSQSGHLDRWRRMGIEPVLFPQRNEHDFAGLKTGVEGLADFGRRGFLGWKRKITEIAEGEPPIVDDEASHIINHALTREELTRFFVNAAKSPSWINWLDQWGHLKRFFSEGSLQEHDVVLARWSVLPFRGEIPNQFLSVISDYHERLNYDLWKEFVLKLGYAKDEPLDSKTLSRWIHILMNCIPTQSADEHYSLLGVAEHCANAGEIQCLLQVYDAATANLVRFLSNEHQGIDDSWCALWGRLSEKCLPQTAHTLLERTTMRLEQRHSARIAWNQGDRKTDRDSELRSAIEPHEQDQHLCRIYLLIDVARDCLEWLATHDRFAAKSWCDRFAKADAPLLRRLAIHAIDARQDLSADDKVAWLLERCDVNETGARHEIFRMARNTYQELSRQKREALIQAISNYELPENIPTYRNERLAYHRFNWFCWLQNTDPNCELLTQELDKIRIQYSEFQPRQHPDLPHRYSMNFTTQSPWSVGELLARPASEWLSILLSYQPSQEEQIQSMQTRHSLLLEVSKAAERDTVWGLNLADTMAAQSEWESDLWSWLISAWETVNLDQDSMERILSHLSNSKLYEKNVNKISDFLKKLIQNTDTVNVMQRLDKLHNIATHLHPYAQQSQVPQISMPSDPILQHMLSWLEEAINHPSGKLAEFWICSIAHWRRQQEVDPQELSPAYRRALDMIIKDNDIPGKFGRTILARELHFLHTVDSAWAEQHLLPLFEADHEDFACAWDGFLIQRRPCPETAELLQDKLIPGLQRGIQQFRGDKFSRFVYLYIFTLACFIADRSTRDTWITKFFKEANEKPKVKREFAMQISDLLRYLDESQQQEWWNGWLKDYWKNRLQGVPCRLENGEIAKMLEWVIHLQGVFPEAVGMAVKMEPVILEDHSSLLRQISQSNLIDRHPNELAKFLIYLGQQESLPWFWVSNLNVLENLLQKNLPENLAQGLQELIARLQ